MPFNAQTNILGKRQSPWPTLYSSIVVSCRIPCSVQCKTCGQIARILKSLKLWITFLPTRKNNTLAGAFYVGTMIKPPPSLAGSSWGPNFGKKNTGITCRPGKPSGPFAEKKSPMPLAGDFFCIDKHTLHRWCLGLEQGFTLSPVRVVTQFQRLTGTRGHYLKNNLWFFSCVKVQKFKKKLKKKHQIPCKKVRCCIFLNWILTKIQTPEKQSTKQIAIQQNHWMFEVSSPLFSSYWNHIPICPRALKIVLYLVLSNIFFFKKIVVISTFSMNNHNSLSLLERSWKTENEL